MSTQTTTPPRELTFNLGKEGAILFGVSQVVAGITILFGHWVPEGVVTAMLVACLITLAVNLYALYHITTKRAHCGLSPWPGYMPTVIRFLATIAITPLAIALMMITDPGYTTWFGIGTALCGVLMIVPAIWPPAAE